MTSSFIGRPWYHDTGDTFRKMEWFLMNKLLFMINDNQKMINVNCFPPWLDQRQGFILTQISWNGLE